MRQVPRPRAGTSSSPLIRTVCMLFSSAARRIGRQAPGPIAARSVPAVAAARCRTAAESGHTGAMTSSPVIRLQQVGKRYANGLQALHGIDLQVDAGEFVALLGP